MNHLLSRSVMYILVPYFGTFGVNVANTPSAQLGNYLADVATWDGTTTLLIAAILYSMGSGHVHLFARCVIVALVLFVFNLLLRALSPMWPDSLLWAAVVSTTVAAILFIWCIIENNNDAVIKLLTKVPAEVRP